MSRAGPKSRAASPFSVAANPPGVIRHCTPSKRASGKPPPRLDATLKAPCAAPPALMDSTGALAEDNCSSPPLAGRAVSGRSRTSSTPALSLTSRTWGASRAKTPSARFNSASSGMSSA
ncbi:hypothetical protein D3C73_968170 [compost metagenome]